MWDGPVRSTCDFLSLLKRRGVETPLSSKDDDGVVCDRDGMWLLFFFFAGQGFALCNGLRENSLVALAHVAPWGGSGDVMPHQAAGEWLSSLVLESPSPSAHLEQSNLLGPERHGSACLFSVGPH